MYLGTAKVLSDKEYLKGGWLTEADMVVISLGTKPSNGLFTSLNGKVAELYAIGDCVKPRKMIDAIHEGARIARSV